MALRKVTPPERLAISINDSNLDSSPWLCKLQLAPACKPAFPYQLIPVQIADGSGNHHRTCRLGGTAFRFSHQGCESLESVHERHKIGSSRSRRTPTRG